MVLVAKIERMNNTEVAAAPDGKAAYDAKMRRLFPNSDMRNHQLLKPRQLERKRLQPEDMRDFRVPIPVFCEYAAIMK